MSVLRLDWHDFDSARLRDLAADLVVAADILYDPLDFPYLLNTLAGLSTHFHAFVYPPVMRLDCGMCVIYIGGVHQYIMQMWRDAIFDFEAATAAKPRRVT